MRRRLRPGGLVPAFRTACYEASSPKTARQSPGWTIRTVLSGFQSTPPRLQNRTGDPALIGRRTARLLVNLPAKKRPHKLRIAVVDDRAASQSLGADLSNLLAGEREIPDMQILGHALGPRRLGNHRHAALHVPAQGNLRGSLAVPAADPGQQGIGKDAMLAFGQRSPGLRVHAIALHVRNGGRAGEERMDFNLVDSGTDLDAAAEVCEHFRIEVRNAD